MGWPSHSLWAFWSVSSRNRCPLKTWTRTSWRAISHLDSPCPHPYSPHPFWTMGTMPMMRWMAFSTAFLFTGCVNGLLLRPVQVDGPLEETVIADAQRCFCRNKVAIIDVDGMILNCKTSSLLGDGDNPVSAFREKLDTAAKDRRVKAVVLRVNSPGGAATASDIL